MYWLCGGNGDWFRGMQLSGCCGEEYGSLARVVLVRGLG
jgi:hypothetical protein